MAHYKVVTCRFTERLNAVWGEPLYIEKETLDKVGATIVEADGGNVEAFIQAAEDAYNQVTLYGPVNHPG